MKTKWYLSVCKRIQSEQPIREILWKRRGDMYYWIWDSLYGDAAAMESPWSDPSLPSYTVKEITYEEAVVVALQPLRRAI